MAAGDEILKVADGPERMTIAEIDGMLYLASYSRKQLERAPSNHHKAYVDGNSAQQ